MWAQAVPYVEAEIAVLAEGRWLDPARDAARVHICINPANENRFFAVPYRTAGTLTRVRLTIVDNATVYKFASP